MMFVQRCDKKILYYSSFIMLLFSHNVESRNWLDCPGPGCPANALKVKPAMETEVTPLNREVDTVKKGNFQVCNQSGVGINYSVNNDKSYLWHNKCKSWHIQGKASLTLEQPHRTEHLKSTYTINKGNYTFISTKQNQGMAEEEINIILKPVQ